MHVKPISNHRVRDLREIKTKKKKKKRKKKRVYNYILDDDNIISIEIVPSGEEDMVLLDCWNLFENHARTEEDLIEQRAEILGIPVCPSKFEIDVIIESTTEVSLDYKMKVGTVFGFVY